MRERTNSLIGITRALIPSDDGVALVMALVVMCSFAISTMAIATLMTSNEHASGRDRDAARAFSIAEAGLNDALSVLSQQDLSGSQAIGSTLSSTSFSLDSGSGTYSATKTGALEWTVSATGTSPNGAVTRRLEVKVAAHTVTTGTTASTAYLWGFFVASTTGCTSFGGNAITQVSVWVANNLCLSGTQAILEPGPGSGTLSVYVGGMYTASGNNTTVGTALSKINTFTAVGGCSHGGNVICSNAAQSKAFANTYSSTPSTLTKPAVDPAGVYASGTWSTPVCSVGTFSFDDNTTRNSSLGTVDILLNNTRPSFDCVVKNPSGTTVIGRLAWDLPTKVLTISGTIFIDGGLSFSGGSQARYQGFGTIYANGSVTSSGQTSLCGPPALPLGSTCVGSWDPAQGSLEIVALNGWSMSGNSELNVLAYVVGNYTASGNTQVTGPVVSDTATLSGNSKFTPITNPPPGAPGAATTVTTVSSWHVVPGSWRQLTG
jgi:Tfp pilus assembly protein PilX